MRVQVNATIDATIDIVETSRPRSSSDPASRITGPTSRTEPKPDPRARSRGGRDDMGDMIVFTLLPPSKPKPGRKPEE